MSLKERQMLRRVLVGQPLSDLASFSINPVSPANGKIHAIRVQDIARQLWFEWDIGLGWRPSTPEVTVGSKTLYIAFYVVNEGGGGILSLTAKDDADRILAGIMMYVDAGAGLGVESGSKDMPNRTYGITLTVTP